MSLSEFYWAITKLTGSLLLVAFLFSAPFLWLKLVDLYWPRSGFLGKEIWVVFHYIVLVLLLIFCWGVAFEILGIDFSSTPD